MAERTKQESDIGKEKFRQVFGAYSDKYGPQALQDLIFKNATSKEIDLGNAVEEATQQLGISSIRIPGTNITDIGVPDQDVKTRTFLQETLRKRAFKGGIQKEDLPFQNQSQQQFKAPIPGQSLTKQPGNAKYERPPQFPQLDDALDFVFFQLTSEQNLEKLLSMLENDVPAEAIARTILFAGFSEGKWTPDVSLLMGKPVLAMIAAIGNRGGIKNMRLGVKERNSKDEITKTAFTNLKKTKKVKTKPKTKGLLSRR